MGTLSLWALGPHARFFRHLGRLLDAGQPLSECLKKAAPVKGSLEDLVRRTIPVLDAGRGLSGAFASAGAVWPAMVWGHLQAGEACGRLPQLLDELAAELEDQRRRILALIFNFRTIWFFIMLLGGSFSLSITTSVRDLPVETVDRGSAAVLTGIGASAAGSFLFYVFLGLFLCIGFGWFQIRGKQILTERHSGFERLRLTFPLFSTILISDSLARYFGLLSKMLVAGLTLPKSLELARSDVAFPQWRKQFEVVRQAVEGGQSLSEGFSRVPHIPRDLITELQVGEASGALSEGMDHYVAHLRDRVKRLRLMVNVAFGILLFVLGVILTLIVAIKGLGAWVPLYERVLE